MDKDNRPRCFYCDHLIPRIRIESNIRKYYCTPTCKQLDEQEKEELEFPEWEN